MTRNRWMPLMVASALLFSAQAEAGKGIRFVVDLPTPLSTASKFDLVAELYDDVTGDRLFTTGIPIDLALKRCPGFPGACTPILVDGSYATADTSLGRATFTNLSIGTANDDYYLTASTPAAGYTSGGSATRDVAQAVVRLDALPAMPTSTVSRIVLQAGIHAGASLDAPIDMLADGVPVRLSLYYCPGPSSSGCNPTLLQDNLAQANTVDGVVPLGTQVLGASGTRRYFVVTTPGVSGISATGTPEFEVVRATVDSPDDTPVRYVNEPFDYSVQIHAGTSSADPIDTRADGVNVRLILNTCPGFPMCSQSTINSNFANATAFNGQATFSGLVISAAGDDRFFNMNMPDETDILVGSSFIFDVIQDPVVFIDGYESVAP